MFEVITSDTVLRIWELNPTVICPGTFKVTHSMETIPDIFKKVNILTLKGVAVRGQVYLHPVWRLSTRVASLLNL
jgi:hypothetical protein